MPSRENDFRQTGALQRRTTAQKQPAVANSVPPANNIRRQFPNSNAGAPQKPRVIQNEPSSDRPTTVPPRSDPSRRQSLPTNLNESGKSGPETTRQKAFHFADQAANQGRRFATGPESIAEDLEFSHEREEKKQESKTPRREREGNRT